MNTLIQVDSQVDSQKQARSKTSKASSTKNKRKLFDVSKAVVSEDREKELRETIQTSYSGNIVIKSVYIVDILVWLDLHGSIPEIQKGKVRELVSYIRRNGTISRTNFTTAIALAERSWDWPDDASPFPEEWTEEITSLLVVVDKVYQEQRETKRGPVSFASKLPPIK